MFFKPDIKPFCVDRTDSQTTNCKITGLTPVSRSGIYDIHYDPSQVDLTGGQDKSSISTIAEELAHSVQFIGIWEIVEKQTGPSGSYSRAKDSWKIDYLTESGIIVAKDAGKEILRQGTGITLPMEDPYLHNKYEAEAKARAKEIVESLKDNKNPCY